MSEPKLISPLLDGFIMGAPISSHYGVRCCPAMRQNSDSKYIVKVISIPASQSQLDALLLTGAYKDPAEATDYFKELADGVVREADALLQCAKLEGFLAYEGCQVVPMEDNLLGYQVYLVGSYKRSLDKYIRRSTVSSSDIIKLALDMCTALSVCRRAGKLYVALKPANIFISDDKEFRIGDLGFADLDALNYTSLPGKYRSAYIPSEVLDPMNTLNNTVDTYSLGMILYQLCQGALPAAMEDPSQPFPAPPGIHGEFAQIIMKAIAPVPEDRWQHPVQMGQAVAQFVQRHGDQSLMNGAESTAAPVSLSDTQVFRAPQPASPVQAGACDTKAIPTVSEPVSDQDARVLQPVGAAPQSVFADTRVIHAVPGVGLVSGDEQYSGLAQSRVSPETKVIPVQSTAPAPAAPAPSGDAFFQENGDNDEYEEDDEDEDDGYDSVRVVPKPPKRARKPIGKGWILPLVLIILLGALVCSGYYYYQNYYLQTIDSLSIDGMHNSLTVTVVSQIDENLLSVTCTDTYGNAQEQPLSGGKATFNDLLPNSQYKVSLKIDGFHKLVGKTSDVFNTESRTEIVSFSGITGAEDGSVLLTFTVEGPEPEEWILTYTAEGEAPLSQSFTGHSVTIKELVVPKVYTFTLSPSQEMYITGQTSLEFTASPLIMAQNLTITSCDGGTMVVRWDAPESANVDSWYVRCYSDNGYEQTLDTGDKKAVFTDVDVSWPYHVEVTANGMTQPARTSITANPITITGFKVDESDPEQLSVSWTHNGQTPEGGWLLLYSLDGSNTQSVVKCSTATAVISPRIYGADYKFVIQAADSSSIFSNVHTYSCPEPELFDDHSFSAEKAVAYLLQTPEKKNWTNRDVEESDYLTQFHVGDSISILLHCPDPFYIPSSDISILIVIRNGSGCVQSKLTHQLDTDWHDMWVEGNQKYAELDLPSSCTPAELGEFSISIYFNGKAVTTAQFSIIE